MSESRFLNFVFTESLLMLVFGLSMLILPKISMISFGFMMCLSFIGYGGYKVIVAILTRNFSLHYILDIIIGLILAINGLFLFVIPIMDIILRLIKSSCVSVGSSSSFAIQTRKILNFWWLCIFLAILEFFFGILFIVLLPSAALWLVGIITGLDFIISGIIYMNMYISTKYVQGGQI